MLFFYSPLIPLTYSWSSSLFLPSYTGNRRSVQTTQTMIFCAATSTRTLRKRNDSMLHTREQTAENYKCTRSNNDTAQNNDTGTITHRACEISRETLPASPFASFASSHTPCSSSSTRHISWSTRTLRTRHADASALAPELATQFITVTPSPAASARTQVSVSGLLIESLDSLDRVSGLHV
jgi:hypothetical protein